jgi:hypothetical protein
MVPLKDVVQNLLVIKDEVRKTLNRVQQEANEFKQ